LTEVKYLDWASLVYVAYYKNKCEGFA